MRGKAGGLTLIELLIASTIFAIVMAGLYSAFSTGLFGFRDIEDNIEINQAARTAFDYLDSDLRNLFAYSLDETRFKGTGSEISFLTLVDLYGEAGLRRKYAFVSYNLSSGSLLRLCRTEKQALNEASEIEAEELSPGIKEIIFNYGFLGEGEEELQWQDFWDDEKSLPLALKINLTLESNPEQKFERTIFLR